MGSHPGTFDGEPCTVELSDGMVSLAIGEVQHGPRRILDALTQEVVGEDSEWTVGLGAVRGRYVPSDGPSFHRDFVSALHPEDGLGGLVRMAFETSPSVEEGVSRVHRMIDLAASVGRMLSGEAPGPREERPELDRLAERHRGFVENFADRGWAYSESVRSDGGYLLVIHGRAAGVPISSEEADRFLADRLRQSADPFELVARIAALPLRGAWRWTCVAAQAATAMRSELSAPAAYGWLVLAEGLWRDLQSRLTGERPWSMYRDDGRVSDSPLTQRLTFSWESLGIAIAALAQTDDATYDEPSEPSPTRRHLLLHGNVAGLLESYHGFKAFTVVEALVEHGEAFVEFASADVLEIPPWQVGT